MIKALLTSRKERDRKLLACTILVSEQWVLYIKFNTVTILCPGEAAGEIFEETIPFIGLWPKRVSQVLIHDLSLDAC